jgi:hypothetical protein
MWMLGATAFLSSHAAAALLLWCTSDGPAAAAPAPAPPAPAAAAAPAGREEPRSKLVRPLVHSDRRVSDGRDLRDEAGQSFRRLTEDDVVGGDGAKATAGEGGAAPRQRAAAGRTGDGAPAVAEVNVSRGQ